MQFGRYIAIALLPILYTSAAGACSLAGCSNDGEEVRSSFTIMVTYADKPLAGVAFHIVMKGVEQSSAVTDDAGIVHVEKLSPGLYWLNGELLGTGVVYSCFHVSANPSKKAKSRLTYTWGDDPPPTSRIAGKLVDSQPGKGGTPIWNLVHRTDVPVVGASLKLQDPITRAVYQTNSDQNGKFNFEGVPNGTYVLHLEGGTAGDSGYDPADEVISLNSSATRNWLLFKRRDAAAGSCGGTELELQSN